MYQISVETYGKLADSICDNLSTPHYFNGRVSVDDGVAEHTLLSTLIIYRSRVKESGREVDSIVDVVPVWWEFSTVTEQGERESDFDFGLLRRELIGR